MIAALLVSLALVAVGFPAAMLLGRASIAQRVGEAYLLGAAIAAGVLFVASMVGVGWSLVVLIAGAVVVSVVFWIVLRRAGGAAGAPLSLSWSWVDAVTLVLFAGYARFAVIGPTAEYDFIGIWGVKAKMFFAARGLDWRFLQNPFNEFAHVDYPILVPLLFDVHAVAAGEWPGQWLGFVNIFFGAAALLMFRSFIAEETESSLVAGVATLAAVSAVLSPWIGLAEGPLVAYGMCGLLHLRRACRDGAEPDAIAGAIHLGLAANCKNEGLTLIVAAAAGLIAAGRWRFVARLWPAAALAAPWLIVRSVRDLRTDLTTGSMLERAVAHAADAGAMIEAMARYPLGRPLLWSGITLAIVLGARRLARRERFLATAIVVQLLFFVAAYLVTPHDVTWHVRWSWERIVSQLTAVITFLAFVVVRDTVTPQDAETSP